MLLARHTRRLLPRSLITTRYKFTYSAWFTHERLINVSN